MPLTVLTDSLADAENTTRCKNKEQRLGLGT